MPYWYESLFPPLNASVRMCGQLMVDEPMRAKLALLIAAGASRSRAMFHVRPEPVSFSMT